MRRLIDIVVAIFALVVLSPILLVLALIVVLDSPGSPLYGGWRIGRNGMPFRMWKFRTMVTNADRSGSITGRGDPRITRVGHLLRKTKLDETPQFLNLLLGQVTLVGPRPESPDIVALYTPEQKAVLSVKPGITGRVQLDSGEESESLPAGVHAQDYYVKHVAPAKIRRDLEYLRVRSLSSDARIVFETSIYVLRACFHRGRVSAGTAFKD